MNEQRMQFAIGIVTLIAGFALAAIIIWFGEFQAVLAKRTEYTVYFNYAPGVEEKIPIRRAGIRIGEVREVEYVPQRSQVRVVLLLEGENRLYEGDEAVIRKSFPLPETYIEIETRKELRGVLDRPLIDPSMELAGKSPDEVTGLLPDAQQTMTSIQQVSDRWAEVAERTNRLLEANEQRITTTIQDTREAMERLNTSLESFNNVLTPESQEHMRVTLVNVRKASENMGPLIEDASTAIKQITETTSKLDEVAANLQRTTKPMAEKSETTLANLDAGSESLRLLLADAQVMVKQFREQDGTIQRLAKDPSLYQNLDDAAFMLLRNLNELERVMGDLRVFADKIARHPGELGVQGVMSRDTGLKNAQPGKFRK